MLDKFIFENHLGQRFEGLENGVYLDSSQLRDYTWKYDTINSKISRFYHAVKGVKIPLVFMSPDEGKTREILNKLHELAASDIEAVTPGKVYCGEYYTLGYITASAKSDYLNSERYCKINLTMTREDHSWYREQLHRFLPTESSSVGEGYDFPYDYPYDYETKSRTTQNIVCDSARGSAFRLVFYGPVTNPSVKIGGHEYSVSGTIGANETLTIDSLSKKITLSAKSGQKINWFDRRNRDRYIFETIPAGINSVTWDGTFGFDLTVIEKRSEPRWT